LFLMTPAGGAGGDALVDALTGLTPPPAGLRYVGRIVLGLPSSKTFSHNDGDVDNEAYSEAYSSLPLFRFL
jgi:hypothetical protein